MRLTYLFTIVNVAAAMPVVNKQKIICYSKIEILTFNKESDYKEKRVKLNSNFAALEKFRTLEYIYS